MSIELLDPNDTGGIPTRIDDLGTDPTEDLRHHLHRRDTTGENTQNLGHEIAGLPPRRRPEADVTAAFKLVEMPLGMVADVEDTAVHTILDSLAGAVISTTGEFEGPQKPPLPLPKLRRSVPVAAMVDRTPPGYAARARYKGARRAARRVSPWLALAIVVGFGVAVYAGVLVAVLAVVK